ncbi:MAG: SDR family oxidoreductase [Deltaproteobacteria bacterium]|nr:SDR family oxidoreductase [Deltaproteobacteria bacterium]MCB9787201.1 SDR family oxidoreductase [Deltaproteobacteria bacterium]
MELSLAGRHALVCGGSAGIGRASALALAGLGAEVTVLARSPDRLADAVSDLRQAGAQAARSVVADLADRPALGRAIDTLLAAHGPVHVLVNNSGGPPSGPLVDATEADFLAALGPHLFAAHLLVQRCLPGMVAADFGRIINVISTSVREPIDGLGVSNTTRAAVAAWAKTLSRELPPGVTINNVLPGFTDTDRLVGLSAAISERTGQPVDAVRAAWVEAVPEGRIGRPDELGAVVAFLASPAAAYVRGTSLAVDGGRMRGL